MILTKFYNNIYDKPVFNYVMFSQFKSKMIIYKKIFRMSATFWIGLASVLWFIAHLAKQGSLVTYTSDVTIIYLLIITHYLLI